MHDNYIKFNSKISQKRLKSNVDINQSCPRHQFQPKYNSLNITQSTQINAT